MLGDELVGLYVYGSLVTGDFDERISDVDLLAVTRVRLDDNQFGRLDAMHHDVVARHPDWADRIEVAYFGSDALETFRTDRRARSPIAVISPGEPFHTTVDDEGWLLNWYVVRHDGLPLLGPPTSELFGEITVDELRGVVRLQMHRWRSWVRRSSHPGALAYAVLTACRASYLRARNDALEAAIGGVGEGPAANVVRPDRPRAAAS